MKNKFSVLMSVYYKEKPEYLKLAIDSVINQTLKPNEIVIVEDGKLTDELEKVISEYEKKYKFIKVIRFEKNRGLGIALNEGIKHCSYDYIARMDSDDVSLPNRFEIQIGFMNKYPQIDVIGSNICEYDISLEKKLNNKIVPESNEDIYKYMKKRNPFNHMTVIYKKTKVITAGSYIDCPGFEDYYLWARMASNKCNFYNIQENLVKARTDVNMIYRRGGKEYNKYIISFENKIKKIGVINSFECLCGIAIRVIVSSLPIRFRTYFYKYKLRNN